MGSGSTWRAAGGCYYVLAAPNHFYVFTLRCHRWSMCTRRYKRARRSRGPRSNGGVMTNIEPTVVDLDDRTVYERLDPAGMRGYIERLPAQCREAWDAGRRWALPPDLRRPGRVLVLG